MPAAALAHPGHYAVGFIAGALHPLSSADHVIAMVAAGLWAAQLGGRMRVLLPVVFVFAMLAGLRLGAGMPAYDSIEVGILVSVLALAAAVSLRLRAAPLLALLLVGGFAVLHGVAHAVDMGGTPGAGYAGGMLAATGALQAVGLWCGRRMTSAMGAPQP